MVNSNQSIMCSDFESRLDKKIKHLGQQAPFLYNGSY